MEFEGIVFKLLPPVSGTSARGEWKKQEVIFEQPGEFNRKICVGFWGDRAADAAALREGDHVAVAANVESREFNGRWYTEIRAWKMERKGAQGAQGMPPVPDFQPSSDPGEPAKEEFDDLPF